MKIIFALVTLWKSKSQKRWDCPWLYLTQQTWPILYALILIFPYSWKDILKSSERWKSFSVRSIWPLAFPHLDILGAHQCMKGVHSCRMKTHVVTPQLFTHSFGHRHFVSLGPAQQEAFLAHLSSNANVVKKLQRHRLFWFSVFPFLSLNRPMASC